MGKLPQILLIKENSIESLEKETNKYLSGKAKITKSGNYKIISVETRILETECSATITYQMLLPNETLIKIEKRIRLFNKKFVEKCKKLRNGMKKEIIKEKISEFFKRDIKETKEEE